MLGEMRRTGLLVGGGVSLAALATLAALLGFGGLLNRFEQREYFFPTYAQLVASGSIGRGWAAAWLPSSARDIRLRYDLDTSDRSMSFRYNPNLGWAPPSECTVMQATDAPFPRVPVKDCPSDIGGSAASIIVYRVFRCQRENGYIALDEKGGIGYFWAS